MTLPHPEDWDITVPELAMLLEKVKHGKARESFVMNRFFVTNATASHWLRLVREYQQREQAS